MRLRRRFGLIQMLLEPGEDAPDFFRTTEAGVVGVRVFKHFTPMERVVFLAVLVVLAAYFAPKFVRAFSAGYSAGAEIRRQQGR